MLENSAMFAVTKWSLVLYGNGNVAIEDHQCAMDVKGTENLNPAMYVLYIGTSELWLVHLYI
jgi:hypothetical protein